MVDILRKDYHCRTILVPSPTIFGDGLQRFSDKQKMYLNLLIFQPTVSMYVAS